MRPLDAKQNAAHALYDQTFCTAPGAPGPLLIIGEYKHERATQGNDAYIFFLNNHTFPTKGNAGGGNYRINGAPLVPHEDCYNGPDPTLTPNVLQVGTNTIALPAHTINIPDHTGATPVTIRSYLQLMRKYDGSGTKRRIRLLIPVEDAVELVRIWTDDLWNGTTNLPTITGRTRTPVTPSLARREVVSVIKDLFKVVATIKKKDDDPYRYKGYKGAKRDLMIATGAYCAYCEARHQDGVQLAVEHRIPKDEYRTEYLRWENFVLACSPCNSSFKGIKPTRADAIGWAMTEHYPLTAYTLVGKAAPSIGGTNRLPYHQILSAAQDHVLWPDVDDGGYTGDNNTPAPTPTSLSFRLLNYELHELDNNNTSIGVINSADATHLSNRFCQTLPGQIVEAEVWDSARAQLRKRRVQVRVAVRPITTIQNAFDTRKQAAAARTIQITGLNENHDPFKDRRMVARTQAWFHAILALRTLLQQIQTMRIWERSWLPRFLLNWEINPPPAINLDDQWNLTCYAAEQSGFYSIWLIIFKQHQLGADLARKLNTRATGMGQNLEQYRGTNIDSVTRLMHQI